MINTSNYFSQGPTEAERKIEELTRQLEEEMEKQEEEGEYFGKKNLLTQCLFARPGKLRLSLRFVFHISMR